MLAPRLPHAGMTQSPQAFPDDVDVAVVSHNGRHTLPRVLACLRAAGAPPVRTTLYDIASTDETRDWMARDWPDVRVVTLQGNVGPNPARNLALRQSTRPYVLLVDSDAYLHADAVPLLRAAIGGPDVGAAVPIVVHEPRPDHIQYGGASLHFLCEAINPWLDRPVSARGDANADIGTAPGVCLLLKVRAATTCGAFDERYFMGKEDGEFCYRLRVAGYRIVEVARAVVEHASRPRSTWLFRYQLRNRWHFILRNYEGRTLSILAPALLLHEPVQLVAVIMQGQLRAWVRALRDLLPWLRTLPAERRAVRAMRRTPDRELLSAAPLVVRADVVGGSAGQTFKRLYDRWLAAYWRLASAFLS